MTAVVGSFAGKAVARLFRLDAPASRAVVFTGATLNSLVVLPDLGAAEGLQRVCDGGVRLSVA